MTWHAVYTNPRSEFLAAGDLFVSGYETLLLHYWHEGFHARHLTKVKKPYFPRYVFAELPDGNAVYAALNTRGVHSLVSTMDGPLTIPSAVIDALKRRGDGNGLVDVSVAKREKLRQGDRLRILSGPFAGFWALIELDNGSDISVWVELLRRKLRVNVAPDALVCSPQGR